MLATYQNKYGTSAGVNCNNEHKRLEREFGVELTPDTVRGLANRYEELTKAKNGTTKLTALRVLETLGADCGAIRAEYDDYIAFKQDYIRLVGRKQVIQRFRSYYLPIKKEFGKALRSGKLREDEFSAAFSKYKTGSQIDTIIGILTVMKAHKKYIRLLQFRSSGRGPLGEHKGLWERFKAECRAVKKVKGRGYDYYTKYSSSQIQRQDVLDYLHLTGGADKARELDEKESRDFCMTGRQYMGKKIHFLEFCGNQHVEKLLKEKKREDHIREYCTELRKAMKREDCRLYGLFTVYEAFEDDGGLENVHNMKADDIMERFESLTQDYNLAYSVIVHLLAKHDARQQLEEITAAASAKLKGITMADEFRATSEWRRSMLDGVMDKHKVRVQTTATHKEDTLTKLEYVTTRLLLFIDDYAARTFPDMVQGEKDPIKWFLSGCTPDMVRDLILEYGKSQNVDNTRVKGQVHQHHAKRSVSQILTFFQDHGAHLIPCSDRLHDLSVSYFVKRIENRRQHLNPGRRRVYRDEEISAMKEVVKEDIIYTLIITILQEIGLRSGALRSLSYFDLFDDTCHPKHVCRVREKGNTFREFVLSTNLKAKLTTYHHHTFKDHNVPARSDPPFYILNARDHSKVMPATTMTSRLKTIATKAGVTDVDVHPHSFRHTIVGKLIQEGNSCEVVSKFIGHSDVNTTISHYWLKSVDDLAREINNPFLRTYPTKKEKLNEYEEEIDNLNRRLDAALGVIYHYDRHLTAAIDKQRQAVDVKNDLLADIPNLEKLVKNIADSVAGSTCTGDSSVQDFI